MKKSIILITLLGFLIGSIFSILSLVNISNETLNYGGQEITFQEVSCEGASCNNMFSPSDNCKETPTSCCEGGTGYNLTCSISCDSGSTINCGSEDSDPGKATLFNKPCFIAS